MEHDDRSLHRIQQVSPGPATPHCFDRSFFLAHVENGHSLSAPDRSAGEKRIAGDQNPMGSGPDYRSDSARHHVVRDTMDSMAARLPTAARFALVRICWPIRLSTPRILLVVV